MPEKNKKSDNSAKHYKDSFVTSVLIRIVIQWPARHGIVTTIYVRFFKTRSWSAATQPNANPTKLSYLSHVSFFIVTRRTRFIMSVLATWFSFADFRYESPLQRSWIMCNMIQEALKFVYLVNTIKWESKISTQRLPTFTKLLH